MDYKMYGWSGKIARVDLTQKKVDYIYPKKDILTKYIGGKGLAGYYMRPHITRNYDDPEMPVCLFTGPLVNTPSPTSGRMTVMSKSPQTGTVGDTSVGGSLGFSLKKAGLDGILITGKSENLCGLEIDDDLIQFTRADQFLHKTTSEIHSALKEKGAVVCTGPAADNNVLFACIAVDGHFFAGRGGLGLVFSAKNLKYITVKGSQKTEVKDRDALGKAREDILRLASASPILMGELGITHYGTSAIYDLMSSRRMMPTNNFRETFYDESKNLNAFAIEKKYEPKTTGCFGCTIRCKKVAKSGKVLPEFETQSHFTALIGAKDIEVPTEANIICNELGMDTISAGATVACYQEIQGKQLSPDQVYTLLTDIGNGKGEGAALGQGSYRYALALGKPEVSMSVKKLELPAYDPRGAYGMALAYATSTRGGCHLRAYPTSHEILRKPVATDRFSFSGKARIIKIAEDLNACIDSLTACKFIFFSATLEEYGKAYSAVTGIETSGQELLKIGERIYYHERIMNALNGFTAADDDLPARFFENPGSSGNNIQIHALDREEFLNTRRKYYKICGLDKNGMPTKQKANELGLEWE